MYRQCKSRGFAASADVLMDIGVLDKKKYDDWRQGRVPYLEAVCMVNLHKLYIPTEKISHHGQFDHQLR